jgi:hypothetical protein
MQNAGDQDAPPRAAAPADPAEVREEGVTVNPGTARKSAQRRASSRTLPRAPGPGARGKRGETYAESARKRREVKEADRLRSDLREFASARPSGWEHDDWLAFLEALKERGHDTSEPERIGLELERERLAVVLSAIPGIGPRRADALVARFDTLWSMRRAGVDEVAGAAGIPRSLAERVVEVVRAGGS